MPTRARRNLLISLLFLGAAAVMVQCTTTTSDAPTQHPNGLTCQSYTNYFNQGLTVTRGSDCTFKCPDGRLLSLPGAVVSQSKDELNFLFCGVPLPTATAQPNSPSVGTAELGPTPTPPPLLTSEVSSCDLTTGVINFRFVEPPPVLTGRTLSVLIQGQPSPCSVPAGFPGSLSCKLPPNTSFPTGVVVTLDNAVVNTFSYSGVACQVEQASQSQNQSQGAVPTSLPPTQRPTPKPTNPRPTQPPPTQPPPTQPPATEPPPTIEPPTIEPPTIDPPTVDPPTIGPPPTHEPRPTGPPRPTHAPRPTKVPPPTKVPLPIKLTALPGSAFGAYLLALVACLLLLAI